MALSFEFKFLKWGYTEHNGPDVWGQQYPVAVQGKRQSPINVVMEKVQKDPNLTPVKAVYEECDELDLENTGKSWQLHFHDEDVSSLTGGPLHGEYKIVQMHAHWGSKEGFGSEHTIDGVPYDAEIHIVHYNTKYDGPGDAFDKEDGLAVLGMLVKVGKEHPEMEKIVEKFGELENPNDITRLEDVTINPGKLLPEDRSYFTYPGSLTTPPLHESVTWILFKQHIEMSQKQLDKLRSLKYGSKCGACMVNNFRPPCHLADRNIRFHQQ